MSGARARKPSRIGLGGCIMVLVHKPHSGALLETLTTQGIRAAVFRPMAGACSLNGS